MKTWAALAAALVLSGCSGSDSGDDANSAPTASATPDGLGMAAACAQVQMATDEIGGSGALGSWSQPTYLERTVPNWPRSLMKRNPMLVW